MIERRLPIKVLGFVEIPGMVDLPEDGNIQMALVWMRIYELTNDSTFLSSAFKMIDLIKNVQNIKTKNSNINGAIKGSLPVYGRYAFAKYPNWATKFFADALMLMIFLKSKINQ